jgi:hypothetical protein
MPILDIHSTHLIYGDGDFTTNNPQRRYVDWSRHVVSVAVENPSARTYDLMPGEERVIFSGTRSTSVDETTAFTLTLSPVNPGVYRLAHTSGAAPSFRPVRVLDLTGEDIVVSINNNATASFSLPNASTSSFSSVQVGDTVFVPGVSTGDGSSPFNPNNGGFWIVLSRTAKSLTLRRPVGDAFVGVAETVTISDESQIQIFGASGVQLNDSVEIAAGFSPITQRTVVVSSVTPSWVEFLSTEPLPLESDILPGPLGIVFYSDAKRFIRVETDQEAVVRLNGDTGSSLRLSPRFPGDPDGFAYFEKWGSVWQLSVVNRSNTSPMNLTVLAAE